MSAAAPSKTKFYFQGFNVPAYTPVPDDLFDILMPELTEAELKVVLYIIRRTFGFKKTSDDISLKQMIEGIKTKDGKTLDRGTGLAKSTASRAIKGLIDKGIIIVRRNSSPEKGDEPTTYQLRFKDDPVFQNRTRGGSNLEHGGGDQTEYPRVLKRNTQETVLQETVKQQQSRAQLKKSNNNSSGEPPNRVVVALVDKGISQSVAQRLASRYSKTRIYEKIDYLDYLLEHAPDKVTNPRGWLRRAIEENYGPPDGYQTKAEREQAALAAKQRQEKQQRLVDAQKQREEAEQAAAAAELARKREAALTSYDTSPTLIDLWEKQLLPRLQSPLALANSLLVALEGTEATVWLPNEFFRERVERQHLKDICRVLAKHLQVNLPEVTVNLVCPPGE